MKFILWFLFSLVVGFTPVIAQTDPTGITYQGRLTDASNAPVPHGAGYAIEVRLWSARTGVTLLWGTRYTGVPLQKRSLQLHPQFRRQPSSSS